jgi:hypothetical protein
LLTTGAVIGGLIVGAGLARAQDKVLLVLDDEQSIEDMIEMLTNGEGTASVEKDDPYLDDGDGKAALRIDSPVGDNQKFNPNFPGWAYQIVEDPAADDEFRYITFAWLKGGGEGMQLQLSAQPGGWGHR